MRSLPKRGTASVFKQFCIYAIVLLGIVATAESCGVRAFVHRSLHLATLDPTDVTTRLASTLKKERRENTASHPKSVGINFRTDPKTFRLKNVIPSLPT